MINNDENKKIALAILIFERDKIEFDKNNDEDNQILNEIIEEIKEVNDTFDYKDEEYLVFDDETEVDEYYRKCMDDYIDEVVFQNIPIEYQIYFDFEKFIEDNRIYNSEFIATYDGIENIIYYDSIKYFIYRIN